LKKAQSPWFYDALTTLTSLKEPAERLGEICGLSDGAEKNSYSFTAEFIPIPCETTHHALGKVFDFKRRMHALADKRKNLNSGVDNLRFM